MDELGLNTVITLVQALHLVGLVPCLFLIFFLSVLALRSRQAVIPILYFAALAAGFALPLLDIYPPLVGGHIQAVLLFSESLLGAFSFLLILQFLMARVPPAFYWLVLAIPLVGGSSFIYAGLEQSGMECLRDHACRDIASYKTLYNVFSTALIFLLLVYYSSRFSGLLKDDLQRHHKYWLIVALMLLNLFALAIDLARLDGRFSAVEADIILAVLRLSFIYLVITSLFRVFYPNLAGAVIAAAKPVEYDPETDRPHADKIRALLEGERKYREMRLNRAMLAELVGINEHALSRVINRHFGKNFNELVNGYRIEEAKFRLRAEPGEQVTIIAFETGFNSIASFNRVFRGMVGVSPTQWRSQQS